MKNRQIIATILAAVLLTGLLAGCNGDSDDPANPQDTPDFVYVPETINLTVDVESISYLVMVGDKLYFSATILDEDKETYSYSSSLYSMNVDGTGIAKLPNYAIEYDLPEGAQSNESINAFCADLDGNLWVTEQMQSFIYDLPDDFDKEVDSMWEYYQELESRYSVRKLDTSGAELLSVDISAIAESEEYFYVNKFNIDGEGNLYIGEQQNIYVLNSTGGQEFKIELDNWIDQLVRMSDGSIACTAYAETGRILKKIDYASRNWGESIDIPYNAYYIYSGGGEYSFLYSDGTSLFAVLESTGETVRLLNWLNSGVSADNISNVVLLPDGRILCTNQTWDQIDNTSRFELIILTSVPYDSLPEKITLTLACMSLDWNLRPAILEFNKNNPNYRIEITDYTEYSTPEAWDAGLTRLSTEIISGNVPDLLLLNNLPYQQYAARGLLEDFYPYIDSDSSFSRGDFMESVFRAAEINGKLYQVFPNFYVTTLAGHPSVLGSEPGWNMNEFMDVIRANPQATSPLGMYMTKESFINTFLAMNLGEYVDWGAGTTRFDSGEFAQMLEFANTFPDEVVWDEDNWQSEEMLIASGAQIIKTIWMGEFINAQMEKARFGGEIVYKGYPTVSRNGNSLTPYGSIAMTTSCKDKEGAWSFIRTILSEDFQSTSLSSRGQFPTNRAVFSEMLKEAMTPEYYTDEEGNEVETPKATIYIDGGVNIRPYAGGITTGGGRAVVSSVMSVEGLADDDGGINIYAMTEVERDQILSVIDSIAGLYQYDESLMEIVLEGARDYFNGRSSAQDAARVIQNRASIYISEQS